MGMFRVLKKRHYMEWNEFNRLIEDMDSIRFIDQTARISINNYWKKEVIR